MKKYIKLSLLAAAVVAVLGTASCAKKEADTDQLGGSLALAAMSPNPVVRGAELHLFGVGMDKVVEVRIPGIDPIKSDGITKGEGKGRLAEIVVTVPLEGPQVGKVVVADASGNTSSSHFDLTYTEGIVFEGFECKDELLPGDVITLKGEYMNNIQEVIFASGSEQVTVTGKMIFDKTRHSTKVYVPGAATSGIIKVSDLDQAANPTGIANVFPSTKEITVGKPTVDVMEFEAAVKAGTVLTFTGNHLDMIAKVSFSGIDQDEFEVNDDATELKAALPAKSPDGDVVFTSFAGDTFVAGTVDGVLPSGLQMTADEESEDPRFKAGYRVVITGEDLDLVSGVSFGGVSAGFYYDEEAVPPTVYATIPATAPDGDVVVHLANGDEVVVKENLELVNPTVDKVSATEINARETFEITGKDLTLVSAVSVGGIACEFTPEILDMVDSGEEDEDGNPIMVPVYSETKIIVTSSPVCLSGDVVIEKLNGWSEVIGQMIVNYAELVTIEVPVSVAMGKPMVVTGTNLFAIDRLYIKGKQVVNWISRSDTEIKFELPEGVGPGVYHLDMDLNDGSSITWAIGFEVTAPYTETFFWEGSTDLNGGVQAYLGDDGALAGTLVVGDLIRVYFTVPGDDWWFQIYTGHWEGMLLEPTPATYDPSAGYCVFEVTDENIGKLTATGGWGGVLVVQGSVTVTGASVIHFGATETVIYEGPTMLTWGDDGRFGLALKYFEDAGADSTMTIYFTQTEDWGQAQLNDGWWSDAGFFFSELGGAYLTTNNAGGKDVTKIDLTITQDILNHMKATVGDYFGLNTQYQGDGRVAMVIQGNNWIIDKITIQ